MLNYPTLLLVLVVFTTVTTALIVTAAFSADAPAEQRLWAMGSVSASLGFGVGAMNSWPAVVHAGVSYGLMGMGLALALRGMRQFCGQTLAWRWVALISLIAFALPAYYAVVVPDKAARLVVSGLFLGLLSGACCVSLWRGLQGSTRSVMWSSVGGFAMIGMVMVGRAVFVLVSPAAAIGAQTIETIAGISILSAAVAQVMIAFGLIMLVSSRYAERLSRLTLVDGLTGVLNRVGMERMGERVLMRARQSERPVAVVMVDADFFKAINDSHGHPAGDQVLVHLAQMLSAQVRPGDLVIRYGGEEFVLMLDGSTRDDARVVAERLRRQIEESRVATGAGEVSYRISAGVSCSQRAGHDIERLVTQADAALYRAKQEGRNRVCAEA